MEEIEIIARAIIIKGDKILVCKSIKQGHCALPGGHVEVGESAEDTLKREMNEEAGAIVTNIVFTGIFENTYKVGEEMHHEINIIFIADVLDENILSKEPHISFEWLTIETLSQSKFLPKIFAEKIVQWNKEKGIIYLGNEVRSN
jgi:ADP-ribose pyrophosphatase YjhB (NUDIX family)